MEAALPATPSAEFWRGKKVLLTGHTGFKGSWLTIWLKRLGAQIAGLALLPPTKPNLFQLAHIDEISESHICDLRLNNQVAGLVARIQPQIVFHLAAQSLVRAGYRDPIETFSTNVMGTAHVLNSLRGLDRLRVAVIITSDKVYKNHEWPYPYREGDTLGGRDPYSASKAAAEIVTESYRDAFLADQNVALSTARAGNVIGGGDWSEDRLIPDAVKAWAAGLPLRLRRPGATRPWQHVLEPAAAYLVLAERLWNDPTLSGSWNFGPRPQDAETVLRVAELAQSSFGRGEILCGAGAGGPHEASSLALEVAKARQSLGVASRWTLEESIFRTMKWYRRLLEGADARALCEDDITAFEAAR